MLDQGRHGALCDHHIVASLRSECDGNRCGVPRRHALADRRDQPAITATPAPGLRRHRRRCAPPRKASSSSASRSLACAQEALLDRPEAADPVGDRRQLDRGGVVGRRQAGRAAPPSAPRSPRSAGARARRSAVRPNGSSRVPRRRLSRASRPEGAQHPLAVGALLRLAGHRVGAGDQRRGRDGSGASSRPRTCRRPAQEARIGVEPGDLVLVLVGHELVQVAGDGLGQRLAARDPLGLGLAHPLDQRAVALGIGGILVGGEIARRGARSPRRGWPRGGGCRARASRGVASALHRRQVVGGAAAPLEGRLVEPDRGAVELDRRARSPPRPAAPGPAARRSPA